MSIHTDVSAPLMPELAPTTRVRTKLAAGLRAVLASADVWGCVLLGLAFIVTLRVSPWSSDVANDFGLYTTDAHAFLHGLLPYRDVFFEYPPLAAPILTVPYLLGTSIWGYLHAFAVEMLLFGGAIVVLMRRVAILTEGNGRLAAIAVGISPLLIGAVTRSRFDLVPVAIAVGALFLLLKNRPRLGMAVLGVAVVIKGFPLVAAFPALAWVWARWGRRVATASAGYMAVVVAIVMGAAFVISAHGIVHSLRFQLGRPLQLESTPASILFVLGHLGVIRAPVGIFTDREFALVATGEHVVSFFVMALGVLTVGAMTVGVFRRPDRRALVLACTAAMAAYAAFTNAYSPQYVLWALPLFVAAASWRMWGLTLVMALAMVFTLEEYTHFFLVVEHSGGWIAVLAARNLLTCVAVWLAAAKVLELPNRAEPNGVRQT